MRDHIELDPSPYEEKCAQVGTDDYTERSIKECKAYKHQLERMFPDSPDGTYFSVCSNPHDFGTYREVAVYYETEEVVSSTFAFNVANNLPKYWDEEAKKELASKDVQNG